MHHTALLLLYRTSLLATSLLTLSLGASAQVSAPAWDQVAVSNLDQRSGLTHQIWAVATDANGNVFVTGAYSGTASFGSTVLTSANNEDIFVAKYVPATGTWAWAQSAGGVGNDRGYGIAVSGTSVYVTGHIENDTNNSNKVLFGGTNPTNGTSQVNGASATRSADLLLAKYTDNGTSATFRWAQVGGGTSYGDDGNGVAVSGSSVYVTGAYLNNKTNTYGVVFGGDGTTAGTAQVNGTSVTGGTELVLAKYIDNGSTATLGWLQIGGGNGADGGTGVAVSGNSVYVTGSITNSSSNFNQVLFGGGGTTVGTVQVNGATASSDNSLLLAKYTDNGSTATLGWTQVANAGGAKVAVSGKSVYVTGNIYNDKANSNGVLFGGGGTTAGTIPVNGVAATPTNALLLAKYTDNGSTATLGWTQVGGGKLGFTGYDVAASGTSVYVTGTINNDKANSNGVLFGGGGTTAGTIPVSGASTSVSDDLLLVKYIDNGSTASFQWGQVGGGTFSDAGHGVAVSGQQVFVGGVSKAPATFGSYSFPTSTSNIFAVLTRVTDPVLITPTTPTTPLAAQAGGSVPALSLYPSPTTGRATLSGAARGAAVQVLDALGRVVATATAGADGTASLPGGLAPGLYVVRAGAAAGRLVVE
jgi:hypothetical protein